MFNYSCDKNAVHSIKKAYEKGTEEQRKQIIGEVINSDYIIFLTKHKYGNYAVQHFLKYSDEKIRNILIEKLKSVKDIELDESAKHVLKKIEKLNKKNENK